MMKLMICGKGGCGKSTVSSLLAMEYARCKKQVLVIDSDESNYGLYRQLGAELPRDFTEYFGGKRGVFDNLPKSDPNARLFEHSWTLQDIPAEFVSEKNGVKLMAIGKIHEAGEGCACAMGALARQFIDNLTLSDDEIVITDSEAGVEHFGRGVDKTADAILMIVDPSYESLQLSEKIYEMGASIEKPVYFILNKVDESREKLMRETIKHPEAIIASIPESAEILSKGLKGEALDCQVPQIQTAIDFLKQQAEN